MKDNTFRPVPVMGDPQDTTGGMTVYYLQRPSPATEKLTAYPAGFRMLAGDSFKRNFTDDLPTKGISFNCLGADKPETNGIPNYKCPGGLRAQVYFPSCWNGKNLDTPDHKSHMSYPVGQNYDNGPCPSTHPVHMISIFYEILYDTQSFDDQWNGIQHPFVFSNGDATGYGFHGDFLNGWDVDILQRAIDTCTDASGQVEKCAAVTQQSVSDSQACRLYSTVSESVAGSMSELPGCNPITYGPERAAAASGCSDTTALDQGSINFIDLTSTKKWEYIGCGTDNVGDRAFTGASTSSDMLTIISCIEFCSSKKFTYAGLEWGRECWCSNALNPKYAPKEGIMGKCGMKCVGDANQICGDDSAMSIYHSCEGQTECNNNDLKGGSGIGGSASGNTSGKQAQSSAKASSSLRLVRSLSMVTITPVKNSLVTISVKRTSSVKASSSSSSVKAQATPRKQRGLRA